MKKGFRVAFIILVLVILYLPILILAVYSFTDSANIGTIHGFSAAAQGLEGSVFRIRRWNEYANDYKIFFLAHGKRVEKRYLCLYQSG